MKRDKDLGRRMYANMLYALGNRRCTQNFTVVEHGSTREGEWHLLEGLGLAEVTVENNGKSEREFAVTLAGLAFLRARGDID